MNNLIKQQTNLICSTIMAAALMLGVALVFIFVSGFWQPMAAILGMGLLAILQLRMVAKDLNQNVDIIREGDTRTFTHPAYGCVEPQEDVTVDIDEVLEIGTPVCTGCGCEMVVVE